MVGDPRGRLTAGLRREHYRIILADPPWAFASNSVAKPGRNPRRHYQCMSVPEIAALPIERVAADDAALFLWVPGPLLVLGAHIEVMRAWGFKPTAMGFVWIKTTRDGVKLATGNGFTTRKNAEFCLIGKRGRSVRRDAGVHEVIISPLREHSRKPVQVHWRIERYAAGPYLELFGRQRRKGWTVRGNEVDKFLGDQ